MFKQTIQIFTLTAAVILAAASTALAGGAFKQFAVDGESVGKGNAFVGEADNAAAVYHNPAGTTQLEDQNLAFGFAWIKLFVDHTSPSGVETQMRRENILIPHFFYTNDLGTENFSLGVGVRSNHGAVTEWAEDSFSAQVATRTDLEVIDYLVTGAYKVNDKFSIGFGLDHADSRLSQNKLVDQSPGADAEAQLKFRDAHSLGYTISTLFTPNEKHQFGLIYRSPVDAKLEGDVDLFGLNDLGGNPLFTIFGGTSYSNPIVWNITFPQSAAIGYSFTPNNRWRFNIDAEWTDWSTIEQEVLEFPGETNSTRLTLLSALTTLQLDWEASWAYRIGGEYAFNDKVDLRAGYFYHESPIPDINFNTFLPDNDVHGITLGAGVDVTEDLVVDVAWTGMFFEDRRFFDNTVGSNNAGNINGTYEEFINAVMVTFNYTFGGGKN